MQFDREKVKERAASLAAKGAFIGTSSWKYPGWLGQIYTAARYDYRGQFAKARFERDCLAEYAETFKTVCVDATYYAFPRAEYLEGLAAQVPSDFQFGFKVTDEITLRKYPMLDRFGPRGGRRNVNFLNDELFTRSFLGPLETVRAKVGIIIFQFPKFHATDYKHGAEFVAELDVFLGLLPKSWPYGVEIRNRQWLRPEYFACLARHGVTHVFDSWSDMPPIGEQIAQPGAVTNPNLCAARFLLSPGRKYEAAVKAFQPYDRTQEVNEATRKAGVELIKEGLAQPNRKTFIYVNNRLEGNAPYTIAAMLDLSAIDP